MKVSAPGKTLLAGEYAVLMPGEPALVAAVDRRLAVELRPADAWRVELEVDFQPFLPSNPAKITWNEGQPVPEELKFVVATLVEAQKRWKLPPQKIRCLGALEHQGRKLGLGGSAAIVAAAATALGRLASASNLEISELAHSVHRQVQGGRGSGADVAASLNGQVLRYVQNGALRRLKVHPDIRVLLAFSGKSVKTASRLPIFEQALAARPDELAEFARQSRSAVDLMGEALESAEIAVLREATQRARKALAFLENILEFAIETPELRAAADAAFLARGAGKSSGAGGGDCAVLVAVGEDMAQRVRHEVAALGMWVMDAPIAGKGALDALDG